MRGAGEAVDAQQRRRTGTGLVEDAIAADDAAKSQCARTVDDKGAVIGDIARDRARQIQGCAGIDGGAAGIGVDPRQSQSAGLQLDAARARNHAGEIRRRGALGLR